MSSSLIPDVPEEENPKEPTEEGAEQQLEKEFEKNRINPLQYLNEQYDTLVRKIEETSDEKERARLIAEFVYNIGKSQVRTSEIFNKFAKEKFSPLEEKVKKISGASLTEVIEAANKAYEEGKIEIFLQTILSKVGDYILTPEGERTLKEWYSKLKETTNGKKLVKKIASPFRKFKIKQYIETAALTLLLTSPFVAIGAWFYYQSSAGQIEIRINTIKKELKGIREENSDLTRILQEGPKNEKDKKKVAYFAKFQPAGDYATLDSLNSVLKDYLTSQEVKNEISVAKNATTTDANNYTDSAITNITERLSLTPETKVDLPALQKELTDLTTGIQANKEKISGLENKLKGKADSGTIETIRNELTKINTQIENYQTQLNNLQADYKTAMAGKANTKDYEALKNQIQQLTEKNNELNQKYDKIRKDLNNKQDKKPFIIF